MNADKLLQLRNLIAEMTNTRLFQLEVMGEARVAKKIQAWAVRLSEALAEHDAQPAQAVGYVTPDGHFYGYAITGTGEVYVPRERTDVCTIRPAQAAQPLAEALQVIERYALDGHVMHGDDIERMHAIADKIAPRAAQPVGVPDVFDFAAHLQRQRGWSGATFGPGARVQGVVDHIRKELKEIEADPGDLKEWIDVVILALDGAWRSGASPSEIIDALVSKQTKNEGRVWPDWRTADPNKAIEHDRSKDAAPQPSADAEDAARYRWLRPRLLTADFEYGDDSETVLVFLIPTTMAVSANLDKSIDAARAAEGDGK